jgi:hypothetical protein
MILSNIGEWLPVVILYGSIVALPMMVVLMIIGPSSGDRRW